MGDMLSLLHLEGGACTLMQNCVARFIITSRSTRKPWPPFDQRVALHHADKYHRFTRPTVTGPQRPRREGSHGLPAALSPRMTPRCRACGRTSPAQAPSSGCFPPPLFAHTPAGCDHGGTRNSSISLKVHT